MGGCVGDVANGDASGVGGKRVDRCAEHSDTPEVGAVVDVAVPLCGLSIVSSSRPSRQACAMTKTNSSRDPVLISGHHFNGHSRNASVVPVLDPR